MSNITIKFRDKTIREFKHEGRPGGSYTKRLYYKEGFVVVEDEWGTQIGFPSDIIEEIKEVPD